MADSTTPSRRVCCSSAFYDDPSSSTTNSTVHDLVSGALPYQESVRATPLGVTWLAWSSISVTDGVRQRHAVEPTRRGYLATLSGRVPLEQGAFLPSDAEYGYEACFATPSRQVPKPACFAAGCRRAPWQGAFYDAVQQSMVFYDISQYNTAHMFTIWNCNLVVPLESSAYLLVPGGSNYGAVVGWGGKRVRPKLEAERSKDGSLYDSWA